MNNRPICVTVKLKISFYYLSYSLTANRSKIKAVVFTGLCY